MFREILRSLTIAVGTVAVALVGEGVYVVRFCSRHQAWLQARSGRNVVILNHQYGVPRAGDAVFACETTHRIGSVVLHVDLRYFCAPATTDVSTVASSIDGTCTVVSLDQSAEPHNQQSCDDHLDF